MPGTIVFTRRSVEKMKAIPVPNVMVRYPSGTPSSANSRPNSSPDLKGGEKLR